MSDAPNNPASGSGAEAVTSVSAFEAADYRSIAEDAPALLWATDARGRCTFCNESWYAFTGQARDEALRLGWLEAVHPDDRQGTRDAFLEAHDSRTPVEVTYRLRYHDGTWRRAIDSGRPRHDGDGAFRGFVGAVYDIHDQTMAERAVSVRARQQQAVADLGTFALRSLGRDGVDTHVLMQRAVEIVAEVLDVEYCKVLELLPGGAYVLLRAGVGWREGLVGTAEVDTGGDSQAGYTLMSDEPVVVADLRTEERFGGPALLREHEVVSGVSCVITGQDGEPWGVLGAHTKLRRDFTRDDVHFLQAIANLLGAAVQRQRALQELKESEARLRAVLENLPAGVIIADASGALTYGNPAVERIFQAPFRPTDNPLKYGAWPLYAPDRDEPFPLDRMPMTRSLQTGEVVTGEEMRIRRPDGTWRWASVNTAPVRDEEGRTVMGVAAFVDVTDRKIAEAERDREQTILEAVLEALPVGVIIADAQGRIVRANAATHELWGTTPEMGSWQQYSDFTAWWPDTGERVAAEEWAMTRALVDGTVTRDELIQSQPFDGDGRRYFLNNAAPVRDPEDRTVGGVVAMLDVTDRLAAERALREHKAQLEARVQDATRKVRALASSLSRAEQAERSRIAQVLHDDVQQLLYALKIQVDLALDAAEGEGLRVELVEAGRLLQHAIDATRRLTLSTNPPVLREEGLAAALAWLVGEMSESFPLDVDLDLELDGAEAVGVDDRALLLHTVRELLFNVVKHASVERAELRARLRDHAVVVEVADRGSGFDLVDVLARRSRSFGLANIRERLELNGGTLTVHSTPGDGTRAVITLPVTDPELHAERADRSTE